MSADNGIYLHKFRGGWKVIHTQAIENIYWKADKSGYNKKILYEYFKDAPLFKKQYNAMKYALKLADEIDTEYGISVV